MTVVENASRPEQRMIATTLIDLPERAGGGRAGRAGDDPHRPRAAGGGGRALELREAL